MTGKHYTIYFATIWGLMLDTNVLEIFKRPMVWRRSGTAELQRLHTGLMHLKECGQGSSYPNCCGKEPHVNLIHGPE